MSNQPKKHRFSFSDDEMNVLVNALETEQAETAKSLNKETQTIVPDKFAARALWMGRIICLKARLQKL